MNSLTHQPIKSDYFVPSHEVRLEKRRGQNWLARKHLMVVFAGDIADQILLRSLCSARDVPTLSFRAEDLDSPEFELTFKCVDRVWDRNHRQILVYGAASAPETVEAIRQALQCSFKVFFTPADKLTCDADFLSLYRFLALGVEPIPIEHLQRELSR